MAALALAWGGLVPPGADPASCGLCGDHPGLGADAVTLRAVGFTVALLGAYAVVLHGPHLLRGLREGRRPRLPAAGVAGALVAAAVMLAASPLAYRPSGAAGPGDAGYLWKLSDRLPDPAGSSLLFLALVPAGALAVYALVRRAGALSLPAVTLAAFLAAELPVRLVYQKYFDPMVLVTLALLTRPPDLRTRWDYAGAAVLCVAFVAYALSFADG
jgi:hypothetical protein